MQKYHQRVITDNLGKHSEVLEVSERGWYTIVPKTCLALCALRCSKKKYELPMALGEEGGYQKHKACKHKFCRVLTWEASLEERMPKVSPVARLYPRGGA